MAIQFFQSENSIDHFESIDRASYNLLKLPLGFTGHFWLCSFSNVTYYGGSWCKEVIIHLEQEEVVICKHVCVSLGTSFCRVF